jgi:chromosomal replication initiator protein
MNSEKLNNEWKLICDQIRQYESINPSQMNAFFSRLQPQAMSEDFIMLTADNDFIKTWIELHYMRYIQRALRDLHGVDFTVAIEVDINQQPPTPEKEQEAGQKEIKEKTPVVTDKPLKEEITPSKDIEFSNQQDSDEKDQLEKISSVSTLTFENFVIGESNRMAYSMAVAVAEEPGRPMLNPLFIYGRSGLGKTHLMRAIQNYLHETRPELNTIYVDSADFLSGYVEATVAHDKQKSSYKNFKNK